MEAAAAGVPSIPAIEYATAAESFGFIAEIQGDSFFEPSLGLQRKSIADLIVRLAQLDPPSYEKLGSACRQRMEPFFPMTLAESYKKTIDTASPGILPISIADMVGYRVSAWLFSQVKGFVQRIRLLFFRRGR
jgi:hypothetical protein